MKQELREIIDLARQLNAAVSAYNSVNEDAYITSVHINSFQLPTIHMHGPAARDIVESYGETVHEPMIDEPDRLVITGVADDVELECYTQK